MRGDARIDAGIAIAEIADHVGEQRALGHRLRRRQEHPLGVQPLRLGAQSRPGWPAIHDPLDVLMSVYAVQHVVPPNGLILRRPRRGRLEEWATAKLDPTLRDAPRGRSSR